jgi:hypothetical protein
MLHFPIRHPVVLITDLHQAQARHLAESALSPFALWTDSIMRQVRFLFCPTPSPSFQL